MPDLSSRLRHRDGAALGIVALVAAVFMFSGLGRPYLWQDEAATAVLGERMMRFGKPIGYDGRNLITMDFSIPADAAAMPILTGEPRAAVRYFVDRGDFREDTTWIGHPWGQFVAAGLSLAVLGKGTAAARAPFAAASVLTVVLLYLLALAVLRDRLTALVAAGLLLANPYWVLHGRQCRYYALSGLFELLTVAAFVRWQRGGKYGGALLAVAAWCWFQCDFGTIWPGTAIVLVLGAAMRPGLRSAVSIGAAIALAIAPFAVFYRLFGRIKLPWEGWMDRLSGLLFNMNQFVMPIVVLGAVAALLVKRRRAFPPPAIGLLAACGAIVAVTVPWAATVGPSHYHRYLVHATPLACLFVAWGTVEASTWLARALRRPALRPVAAVAVAGFVALSPIASNLVSWAFPVARSEIHLLGTFLRPEIGLALETVFGHRPDPNREAIALVKSRARPGDEIVVAYEDIPFMFYTDNLVRGGIPAFRVRDESAPPPRFFVARPGVPFGQGPIFLEELDRYRWELLPTQAPALYWGNNPDPVAQSFWLYTDLPKIIVGQRVGDEP
jgi:hypothetical protein